MLRNLFKHKWASIMAAMVVVLMLGAILAGPAFGVGGDQYADSVASFVVGAGDVSLDDDDGGTDALGPPGSGTSLGSFGIPLCLILHSSHYG